MKSPSFFKGLSRLLLLNLLVKPVWIFFIDREVQNRVGNEAYGRYFALLNLSYVLVFLADAGLSNMINQRLANRQSMDLRQVSIIKLFLLGLYLSACFLMAWLSGVQQWQLLLYLVLVQALTSLFIFLRSIITAHQYFSVDAWLSVVDKLLMILICGSLLYGLAGNGLDLLLFLRIQVVCTLLAVLLAFGFLMKHRLFTSGEKNPIGSIARWVLPFTLLVFLMSVHSRLDGFLLERLYKGGAHEAGIYASAFRITDTANMLGYLAASFLVPFIARHQNEPMLLNETILKVRHGLLLIAIGLVCFVFPFADWLQQLLYYHKDAYQSKVLCYGIAVLPAYFLVHIYGSVLTATGRFRAFSKILIVSVLINILLNLFLIPSYGALGSCLAALVSQYLCGLLCLLAASRLMKLRLHPASWAMYLLFALVLTGYFYWMRILINNVWVILAIAALVITGLIATQISFFRNKFISIR